MSFKLPSIIKSSSRITSVIAVFLIFVSLAHFKKKPADINEKIDSYFEQELENVTKTIKTLKISCQKKAPLKILRQQFFSSRLAYKNLAVLSEYFNIYETKFLNGPAVPRVEEDNPGIIIPPQGFQAIEQVLFSPWNASSSREIEGLANGIIEMLGRIKNEPDRINKFRDELIFDALNSAVIRLITMGITGFDSPVALFSLPEAKSTLKGIDKIVDFYKVGLEEKDTNLYHDLKEKLLSAINYLSHSKDFNKFDRLTFITRHANPLSASLRRAGTVLGIPPPNDLRPLSGTVENIFEKDAFNLRFFTPDKQYIVTAERIELGRQLFFDPILSSTKNRSCASCHKPGLAFTDGQKTALAIDNKKFLTRNTPTLVNSVFQTRQFWDSREDILENQLSNVIHNAEEMSGSLGRSAEELKNDPHYKSLFVKAYSEEKEPVSAFNIANAISSYVRSLVSLDSKFDLYIRGDKTQLSINEKKGFNLFAGKAKCATCHFIPLFNGLVPPEFTETESEVLGVPQTTSKKNTVIDPDAGKYDFTKAIIHKHGFKIPTLRNVELTAPYMHNGVFNTLDEVMEFYNNGGGKGLKIAPSNQTLPFDKLNLSKKEIADIISFMKSLTDTSYLKAAHY